MGADATMAAGGMAMMVQGASTVDGGAVALAAGPEVGLPIIIAGAAEMAAGYMISSNAAKNIAKGYNYGKSSDPIIIKEEDKIPRDQLNPPDKPGNAPTFKKDDKPVEIHHEQQSPDGPFKEMHPKDHRGTGNDKVNHPDKTKPSKINRKDFTKQKKAYWKKEFPQLPRSTITIPPKN